MPLELALQVSSDLQWSVLSRLNLPSACNSWSLPLLWNIFSSLFQETTRDFPPTSLVAAYCPASLAPPPPYIFLINMVNYFSFFFRILAKYTYKIYHCDCFKCKFIGIKYIHIFVILLLPSCPRIFFIFPSWNSIPIKH